MNAVLASTHPETLRRNNYRKPVRPEDYDARILTALKSDLVAWPAYRVREATKIPEPAVQARLWELSKDGTLARVWCPLKSRWHFRLPVPCMADLPWRGVDLRRPLETSLGLAVGARA